MLGRIAVSKALLGTHVAPTSLRLLDEVRALRQRVADLEAALAAAEAAATARSPQPRAEHDPLVVDAPEGDREPATA
jgi:hypothetical protein